MPPPANDDRAGAEEVPFGAGSGTVSGTTVDATEEAGGPFDGYGAQEVWYVWTGLPAGTVDFTITPTTPGFAGFYEAWFNNVEPTDWVIDDSIASGSDVGVPFNVNFDHPGGTLTLAVFTYTGDPGGEETDFDFAWSWTAAAAALGNDDRTGAELVPVGDYWGIVSGGTTNGATRDSGAGFSDPDIKDVWYYWDDLPAGIVYLYVKPADVYGPAGLDTRFDVWLKSVTPTSWTSTTGSTTRNGGQSQPLVQFQHTHSGGDLTLAVATYADGVGGTFMDFAFGWGHSLDATPSHWSGAIDDEWVKREGTVATEESAAFNLIVIDPTYRQGHADSLESTPGTTPPSPSLYDCLFENARYGVTNLDMVDDEGCEYQGPSGGRAGTNVVGALYERHSSTTGTGLDAVSTTTEAMDVDQRVLAFRFEPPAPLAFRGPFTEDDAIRALAPSNFDDYDAAASPQLVWGFEFIDDDAEWETRNVTLGAYGEGVYANPDDYDEYGPNTVTLRALPQSVIVGDAAGSVDPDRVFLSWEPVFGADAEVSYITPGVGTHLTTLTATPAELLFPTFGDVSPYFVTSEDPGSPPDDEWVVVLFIPQQTLDGDPPGIGSLGTDDWATSTMRLIEGTDIVAGWDARTPPYRAFLGFPLTVSTWNIGFIGPSRT